MAEGIARRLGAGLIEAYSAGSRPSGIVNPDAVKVMQEIGIDISDYKSKGFADLPLKNFDYAVTLGCQDTCPFVPASKHIEWRIDDPKGQNIDFFRFTRDKIREKIEEFLKGGFDDEKE
jgi:protein-tyrosine-phosphatase